MDLALKGVSKHYHAVRAADNVTLHVQAGELLFLLGPSGCGKTTTLRIVAGLVAPDAGSVIIGGRDVTDLPPYRRNLGMVFQNYALFPHMTVYENLAFGLRMRGVDRTAAAADVEKMLALVQLKGLGGRYPRQLSGGQQQRVALGRALVTEPSVLLLDEPLSNLDAKLRQEMRLELRSIQERLGTTTVFVTHDQEEALAMATRIAVMREGRVEQIGTPQEVYYTPRNRFVADFLGQANFFEGTVAGRDGQFVMVTSRDGAELKARGDGGFHPGQPVTVMVRPERMRIEPGPGESRLNAVCGRVEDVIFIGPTAICYIGTRDGLRRSARYTPGHLSLGRGDPVTLRWESSECQVLHD